MIELRKMDKDDLLIFKKWLSEPHVAKWYEHPMDWIYEIEKQDSEFSWIHHFIVEHGKSPIGFCQYYACKDSDELWEGYTKSGGSYSIDYMIGETDYIRKGYGRQIILKLIEKISLHKDAERIVVQPDEGNKASCGVLLSCGFMLDTEKNIYVKEVLTQHMAVNGQFLGGVC